jgi:hypothetical protein
MGNACIDMGDAWNKICIRCCFHLFPSLVIASIYGILVLYIFKLKWLCYQILLRLYLLDKRNVKILV